MSLHRARFGAFAFTAFSIAVGVAAVAVPRTARAQYADRDKDGVPDNVDACPDTPGVKTNEPKTNGCPNNPWGAPAGASDRDKDGIPDSIDACPDTPGVKQADPHQNGCPLPAPVPNNPWGAPGP